MTLGYVMLSLRRRLLDVMESNNRQSAEEIFITLSTLREVSYEQQNESLTALVVDLVDSARDVASGVKGKAVIPTVEEIQAQFPPVTKSS